MSLADPSAAEAKIESYSDPVRKRLRRLRQLVLETARDLEGVGDVEESLKWGEPSFRVRGGSPIRIDQHGKDSSTVALYFSCQSRLVETFRELYRDEFTYEGDRAIVFQAADELPMAPLRHCIGLALRYHRLKHLPLLGA